MSIDNKKLEEILAKEQYLDDASIKEALMVAEREGEALSAILIEKGFLTKDLLGQAIAEFYKLPYIDLNSQAPQSDLVNLIPEAFAREHSVVVARHGLDGKALVATANPEDMAILPKLQEFLKTKDVTVGYSVLEDIENVFIHYRKPLETRFSQIIKAGGRMAADLAEQIFSDAALLRASDIHFEPHEKELLVRFRIDGVLHDAGKIPSTYHDAIINRIKVLARLRTDEHQEIQDGAIRMVIDGKMLELRVSVAPIYDGEKAVLRVLGYYVRGFTLYDLGFSEEHRQIVEAAARKPFGMILATGPTGSGKTTTLYAITKLLNNPGINITTIEDPVEYKIEGVNHIQVNPAVNLTFAQGLKSIVRQDPDIILVGEIRDNETAEIAINAALTGHLMLSTLHANDAATSIPRLLEMGIEPFLISSTMEVIIAQRLVRRICERCRASIVVQAGELKERSPGIEKYIGKTAKHTFYKGKGCESCNHTGYVGRVGIFEVVQVTADLRELILKKPTISEIYALFDRMGVKSLFEDGLAKAKTGITTLDEVLRVSRPRER